MESSNISDIISACLRGDSFARTYLEDLVTTDNFWNAMIQALQSPAIINSDNYALLLFALTMLSRRVKVIGSPPPEVLNWLYTTLLGISMNKTLNTTVLRSIANCFGLLVIKAPIHDCSTIIKKIYDSIHQFDLLLALFLTEMGDVALSADESIRQVLKGILI